MRILITGTAGFIGFHLARRLLEDGHAVLGVDGFTPYYDVNLKRSRHALLNEMNGFEARELLLEDDAALGRVWADFSPDLAVHLAAQAGVRYSLENPRSYVHSNVLGTLNVLEAARALPPRHMVLASTSSAYGARTDVPFRETDKADQPVSLYAATKKATEEMGHAYSHLFSLPMAFVRFFTVYGPWGRPDMALFKFTRSIIAGEPIDVYGRGDVWRDFTYVDDIVSAIVHLLDRPPSTPSNVAVPGDTLSPVAASRVVNIGSGAPLHLLEFIRAIERSVGRKAVMNLLPMQAGDVPRTFASTDLLRELTGFRPQTSIDEGVGAFVNWYRDFYGC